MKRLFIALILLLLARCAYGQGYPFGWTKVGQSTGFSSLCRGEDPNGRYVDDAMITTADETFSCNQIIPWSGGAQFLDRSGNPCFAVLGGGHTDYHGNEVNVLCGLAGGTPTWTQPLQPTVPVPCHGSISGCKGYGGLNWEGECAPPDQHSSFLVFTAGGIPVTVCPTSGVPPAPSSRHTYNTLQYVPGTPGLIYMFGGAVNNNGGLSSDLWTLDPVSHTYAIRKTQLATCSGGNCLRYGLVPGVGIASAPPVTAYNPINGHILVHDGSSTLYDFDPSLSARCGRSSTPGPCWTKLVTNTHKIVDGYTAAVDPVNNLLVAASSYCVFPCSNAGQTINVYNLGSPGRDATSWNASTCDLVYRNGGIDWDSALGLMVIYPGGGNDLELLNTGGATKVTPWGSIPSHQCLDVRLNTKSSPVKGADYPQDPDGGYRGTFGRFRYLPTINAFLLVNSSYRTAWIGSLQTGPPDHKP